VSAEPEGPQQQPETFEQAQAELEQIVGRLEQGQASLDEAIALWERGEQLYAFCRERLDAAQGKVEELARRVEQARDQTPAEPAA
jgi:exodeoxyribonuclease VII small subunit